MGRQSREGSQGFTLIQLSILLTVAALVLVTVLPSAQVTLNSNTSSTNTLDSVWLALRQYVAANGVLPCPADASLAIGSSNYGVAAANPGATNNCRSGTPAANYVDTTNHVAIGMVPVRTLQLPASAALDGFGRDITYAVDTHATSCWGTTSLSGQIAVSDNGSNNYTIAALISHGADGHGAWLPMTGSSGTALRLNTGSGDNDQHFVNAHGSGSLSSPTFPSNYSTITSLVTDTAGISTMFVKKPPTSTFDDLVVYSSPEFNMSNLPAAYAANMQTPTVSPPANGLWVSGQYLTFTLTFANNVTVVSGTPRLDLTVNGFYGSINGGTTAYANYVSGSGSNTLTFQYLIGTTDYTSMGITLAPSIDMNGAVMTPCPLPFTPPNMSGVLMNSALYIADWGNNRVRRVLLAAGTISTVAGKSSAGSSGDGGLATSAKLNQPEGVAADSSGDVYIADGGNNKIRMISASTGTISTVAGNGTAGYSGDGQLASSSNVELNLPSYITFDASGNYYITDDNNNAIRKVTAATGIITTVAGNGTAGYNGDNIAATSAELNGPSSTLVDSSGNLYIPDSDNSRLREVVASTGKIVTIAGNGTSGYTGTGGAATSAELNVPDGVAMDSAGNIYVSEYGNNWVRKITVGTGVISLYAGTGGQGYNGNNIAATSAEMNEPGFGIMDSSNNYYYSDIANAMVRMVSASTGKVTTIAGNGTEGYNSNTTATSAEIDYAGQVAIVNR